MAVESWFDVLPAVFQLISCETDKIVDDTSLEKLLGLLESTNQDLEQRIYLRNQTTFKFLSDIEQSHCPTAVGFGLRLAGIIGSCPDGFSALVNPGNSCTVLSSNGIFSKVLKNTDQLWSNPVVRDSFFKAAARLLNVCEGILWIQKSGCLQQALECLVDSSIFVAANARKFIAKYIVSLSIVNKTSLTDQQTIVNGEHFVPNIKDQHSHLTQDTTGRLRNEDLSCITCIVSYLKYLIQMPPSGLERAMSCQVSVAQLLLSLMEDNPSVGQDILQESGLFSCCLQLLHTANKSDCGKVIDVITTLMANTSKWNIQWELLVDACGQEMLCTLLEFAFILCQRSFVFLTFQFAQGLFTIPYNLPFELQDSWLYSLFTIITFPVYGSLYELNWDNNDKMHPKDAAKKFFSLIFSRDEAYQKLGTLLADSATKYLSSASISHSLLVTTDIIKQFKIMKISNLPHFDLLVRNWVNDLLTLLSRMADKPQTGDHLLRQCIKALTVCIQQDFLQSLDQIDPPNETKTFSLLLKFSNKRCNGQVLSGCLESIKALLISADQSSLRRNIYHTVDDVTLARVLRRHFSHSCWEVKDSVLGFVKYFISTFTDKKLGLFQEFLLNNGILELVWASTTDIESYIRASAIELVGVISNNHHLWKKFCDAINLSEQMVLHRILDAFAVEEAAFPRRAIIKVLSFWLDSAHNISQFILRQEGVRLNLEPLGTTQDFHLDVRVSNILDKAVQDFDWEVKLCALNFWETVMKWWDRNTTGEQNGTGDDCVVTMRSEDRLKILSSVGLDKVILGTLLDCDRPVRRKGLELMQLLQTKYVVDNNVLSRQVQNGGVHSFESLDELVDAINKLANETNSSIGQVLVTINLSSLAASCDNNDQFSDPMSFLKDILLAATDSDENLLDCY